MRGSLLLILGKRHTIRDKGRDHLISYHTQVYALLDFISYKKVNKQELFYGVTQCVNKCSTSTAVVIRTPYKVSDGKRTHRVFTYH